MKHPFSDTYITNFKLVLDVLVDRIDAFLAGLVIDNKLAILVQLIAAFVDPSVKYFSTEKNNGLMFLRLLLCCLLLRNSENEDTDYHGDSSYPAWPCDVPSVSAENKSAYNEAVQRSPECVCTIAAHT